MFPILFQSGDFILASWHVLFVLGALAAWYLMQRLRTAIVPDWTEGQIDRLFVGLYICGYFGARVFSILFESSWLGIEAFFQQLISFGSMTLYGGILAVLLALLIYAYRRRTSLIQIGALVASPALIAIGIGRLGCYLNGDDYGAAVPDQMHPPSWAVRFPNLDDSIYRYPVQLWEAALGLILGGVLFVLSKRWPQHGVKFADVAVVGYTVGRFDLEFYRGDDRGQFFGGELSTSQGVSLILLVLWISVRLIGLRRGRPAEGLPPSP